MTRPDGTDRNREQFGTDASVASQTRRMEAGRLFEREQRVFDRYRTRLGAETLDLGCGTGRVSRALADRGLDVTGVDVNAPLVRAARARLPDHRFVTAEASALPFGTDRFDSVVFAYNGLDYLVPAADRREVLREVRRVLRPDGLFVFSAHNPWYALPALLADWSYLTDTYLSAKNRGRLFDRYKFENAAIGVLESCFTSPPRQWRELRTAGFDLVDVVGTTPMPVCLFETAPYYVAVPGSAD